MMLPSSREIRTILSRRRLPFPVYIFIVTFLFSLSVLRPSTTLYDPRKSAIYTPPSSSPSTVIQNSIIVPTFKEKDNIRPLVRAVYSALKDPAAAELIIVDDNSNDGTEVVVRDLAEEGYQVSVLVRTSENGLSSAVLRGFERARGDSLVVMDADLQHPAAAVQSMLDALSQLDTPLVLGTRYGKNVSMSRHWPLYRRIISWGARMLARPLTSASDPMTGFFGIRKQLFLKSEPINASGFKIALEILLKTKRALKSDRNRVERFAEIPYSFGARTSGSSKLSSKVMLRYVGQLLTLYSTTWGVLFHLLVATTCVIIAVTIRTAFKHVNRRRRGEHASAELQARKLFGKRNV